MPSQSATFTSSAYAPDRLIGQNAGLLYAESVVVASGAGVLLRGAVLGKITSSGKYVLSLSTASNGSQNPAAVLVDDVDATSADAPALAYTRGDFNGSALILGAAHTIASVREALKDIGIFILADQGGV
jgi:hypothetical protein